MKQVMHIRIASDLDQEDIRSVHWSAFDESERGLVSKLAVDLLAEDTTPRTISLVAEVEGSVVGHVAFSPVSSHDDESFSGYIMAPLGVKPEYQKRCIGSKLVEKGMQQLSEMGVGILFVYGDPEYYSRFGFSVDVAECYTPPYRLQYPFGWQGIALNECSSERSSIEITCVASLCDPVLW